LPIYSEKVERGDDGWRIQTILISSLSSRLPAIVKPLAGYMADQIYGSGENIKKIGGTQEDYERFESKLQKARDTLGIKEFGQFVLLLKDMVYYHFKMADLKGNFHPERLSAEEQKEYDQVVEKLQPYFDKLNAASGVVEMKAISIEESQKMLSFPIKHPTYLPTGYELSEGSGYLPSIEGAKPSVHMQYSKDQDALLILQFEMKQPPEKMPFKFDKENEYSLEGYGAIYGEGGRKEESGLVIWVPKKGEHSSYEIFVTGKLEKDELEKIALSVLN
jgi:hypothetical protein